MSPIIIPPPYVISNEERERFIRAISIALSTLPPGDLQEIYLIQDNAIVISFTADYQPFIGYTMGLNATDHRLYIYQDTQVLNHIANGLDAQGRDIRGGRVFIDKDSAYIKDDRFIHKVILLLDWQENDPCKEIMSLY